MAARPTLVWFRHDLRITDQPALIAAAERGPVIPVFIWAPEEETPWAPGGASRWWLHHSLASIPWDGQFDDAWEVGAPAAERRLREFLDERLENYKDDRNRIDLVGYSKLSPHLRFGEISPRQIWEATHEAIDGKKHLQRGGDHGEARDAALQAYEEIKG